MGRKKKIQKRKRKAVRKVIMRREGRSTPRVETCSDIVQAGPVMAQ